MFPLKNTEAYIHANGFRSTLGKELADRDAEINELGSEIQALTNYTLKTGVKNLLENTLVTFTDRGVTFTHQSDGTILANGTNTGSANTVKIGTITGVSDIILSGCPSGGSSSSYEMPLRDETSGIYVPNGSDYGSGRLINGLDPTHVYAAYIIIRGSYAANNVLFKPMITLSDIPNSDYAHYQPYAKTNVELTADVKAEKITCEAGANITSLRSNVIKMGNLITGNFQFEGACTSSDEILTVPAGYRPENGQDLSGIIIVNNNMGLGYYQLDASGKLRQTSTSSAASGGTGSFAYYIGQL